MSRITYRVNERKRSASDETFCRVAHLCASDPRPRWRNPFRSSRTCSMAGPDGLEEHQHRGDTWKVSRQDLIAEAVRSVCCAATSSMRISCSISNGCTWSRWQLRRLRVERARPNPSSRLPDGVEVQMLELEWPNLNTRNGVTPPVAYVHGELFGVGGVKTTPDNPRGERSMSIENRALGKGSGTPTTSWRSTARSSWRSMASSSTASRSTQKKGYLPRVGGWRSISGISGLLELPPGVTTPEQTAPERN